MEDVSGGLTSGGDPRIFFSLFPKQGQTGHVFDILVNISENDAWILMKKM